MLAFAISSEAFSCNVKVNFFFISVHVPEDYSSHLVCQSVDLSFHRSVSVNIGSQRSLGFKL